MPEVSAVALKKRSLTEFPSFRIYLFFWIVPSELFLKMKLLRSLIMEK